MKRSILLTGAVCLAFAPSLLSQAPQAGGSPKEQLQRIKATNQKIMEQQAATLQKLDELQKEAAQVRILARRT